MRRILAAVLAALVLTAVFLVLPVLTAPAPRPEPVATATHVVTMGSVTAPAPDVAVRPGPSTGDTAQIPTLAVTRTGVPSFSLVGVTWRYDPQVTDTVVQIRVQDDTQTWGSWTAVTPETPDQGTGTATGAQLRSGSSPLWTGPSTGVQVELTTRSGAQPVDVQVDLVDPGRSEADASLGAPSARATAHADSVMPPVYSRAQWGADDSIRTWAPQYAPTIKAATLHHSADSNDYTAAEVPAIMRSIYRYHTVSLGWGDLGYNVVVDKFGRLWEGRYGGLNSTVVGAHAGGFNTGTFGVSMLGNYDAAPTTPVMIDAVAAIIAWKFSLYGVDPAGTTTLTSGGGGTARYAAGERVTLPTIFGHRDVGSTVCPGRYGYAQLPVIRGKVAALMGSSAPLVQARYDSDATARRVLGAVTVPPTGTPDGRGAFAHYANGSVYATQATGARVVRGPIRDRWAALGWENSPLGWPTGDTACDLVGGGCFQTFQKGSLYWSPATGAHTVTGAVRDRWGSTGWEGGYLGYPVTDQTTTPDGRSQYVHFTGGSIYWSAATGAQVMGGPVYDRWAASGWETSALGLPTTDLAVLPDRVGLFQHFQSGSIYYTPRTGAHIVAGAVRDRWGSTGWEGGYLGYPVTDQTTTPDGRSQYVHFTGGSIYWSAATGAQVMGGPVYDRWAASGWETSVLGLPTTDLTVLPDRVGLFQHFQSGSVYWTPTTGARVLRSAVRDAWAASGWERGALGYPVSDVTTTPDGRAEFARFQRGSVYASASTGAHAVSGAVHDAWAGTGWENGRLGLPVGDAATTPDGGASYQHFAGGSVYSVAGAGTSVLLGPVRDAWADSGWERGPLGYPTGNAAAVTTGGTTPSSVAGTAQPFQGGSVYSGPAGTFAVTRSFQSAVDAAARVAVLGLPTSAVGRTPDGAATYQHFAGGSVYSTAAQGTHVVPTVVRDAWAAAGWERGALGYPTGDPTLVGTALSMRFQGGVVLSSRATGVHVLTGPVFDAWTAAGGEGGVLGLPLTDVTTTPDRLGAYASFQDGAVYWSSTGGAHVVRGALLDAWARTGWEQGALGYPVADAVTSADAVSMAFQRGSIRVSTTTGQATVTVR